MGVGVCAGGDCRKVLVAVETLGERIGSMAGVLGGLGAGTFDVVDRTGLLVLQRGHHQPGRGACAILALGDAPALDGGDGLAIGKAPLDRGERRIGRLEGSGIGAAISSRGTEADIAVLVPERDQHVVARMARAGPGAFRYEDRRPFGASGRSSRGRRR